MIEAAVGSAMTLAGFVGGMVYQWEKYAIENRRRVRDERKPICGCKHHFSFHGEDGCHFMIIDHYQRETSQCGCVKYVGPEAREEVGS